MSTRSIAIFVVVLFLSACSKNDDLPAAKRITTMAVNNSGQITINGAVLPLTLSPSDIERVLGKPTRITKKPKASGLSYKSAYIWDDVGMSIVSFGPESYKVLFVTSRNRSRAQSDETWPRSAFNGVIQLPGNVVFTSPSKLEVSDLDKELARSFESLGGDKDSTFKNALYTNKFAATQISVGLEGVGGLLRIPMVILSHLN